MESKHKLLSPGLAVTVGGFVLVGATVMALSRASGPVNPHSCPTGPKGAPHPVLQKGDVDDGNVQCVANLQWDLQQLGYVVSTTGKFDDSTAAAVKSLQTKNGLPNDGQVNGKTWVILESSGK
ncbi:MAG TPA: peptidoglycan-binding domain-containing protein [Candidatus Nanoarchaeia archaeon]|nr:peptidoglycan-binding domain-containing protein [Candidatus Nanoarchaeia archaeon]